MGRTRSDALPIQHAVATASPSAWRDGLVVAVEGDATLERATVTVLGLDGDPHVLATRARPAVGEPVAVHPVAELLALGEARYSARPV